ncbi:MAG: hypothetical protein LRZ85_07025 [Alphaproteobacteria bacterium]|nr:hypothetical protein [Alphaproteobacteria bacterium]MCD8520070.1 hypothetical protein [Alphaproteobacteria bacterium]MCD8570942.1 hypothetical protein [Alphaproteobacteria bacterium]
MKFQFKTAIAVMALCTALPLAHVNAAVIEITPDMQICSENADCTAISSSCAKACNDTPVNVSSVDKLSGQRLQTCGEAVNSLPACEMHPPLEPRCVNNRCTVGFAFDHTADDKDYGKKAGGHKSSAAPQTTPAHNDTYNDGPGYLQLPEGYEQQPSTQPDAQDAVPDTDVPATAAPEEINEQSTAPAMDETPAIEPAEQPAAAPPTLSPVNAVEVPRPFPDPAAAAIANQQAPQQTLEAHDMVAEPPPEEDLMVEESIEVMDEMDTNAAPPEATPVEGGGGSY